MRGVTRREFIKGVGGFGTLCVTGLPWPSSQVVIQLETPCHGDVGARFIGVGEVGCRLGHALCRYPSLARLFNLLQEIPRRRLELVFLAGQADDPTFCLARKRILSGNPYLLFTFVDGQFSPQPKANEAVVRLEAHDLNRAVQSILHVSSIVMIPGYIGVDLADILTVCGGGLLENFQFSRRSHFAASLRHHPLGPRQDLLLILCYSDPELVKMRHLDHLFGVSDRHLRRDTRVVLAIDCHPASDSELMVFRRARPEDAGIHDSRASEPCRGEPRPDPVKRGS